jgi:hypothetical protein
VLCATDLERLGHREKSDAVRAAQAAPLRDVFGNPFRPVRFAPAWLTADVVALAEAAYRNRELPGGHLDPARRGVLADALEGVGAGAELLAHPRDPGRHVRACRAVDIILARG